MRSLTIGRNAPSKSGFGAFTGTDKNWTPKTFAGSSFLKRSFGAGLTAASLRNAKREILGTTSFNSPSRFPSNSA